jgi:hypothetical protein
VQADRGLGDALPGLVDQVATPAHPVRSCIR